MSPVFDKSALYRRWLHLPSIAVIALAGASVAVSYKGIDAWRARWIPKHETERLTTQLVGRAEIPHVQPDRIEWGVTVAASGKGDNEATLALVPRTHEVVEKLVAAGVPRGEIFVDESVTVAPKADVDDVNGGLTGNPRHPPRPQPYEASQAITIRSRDVRASLAARQAVALDPTPSMHVTGPRCWREDLAELRRKAQAAAWDDLDRQANQLRAAHGSLGRVMAVDASDAEVSSNYEPWRCDEDQTARATVTLTYELR